MRIDMKREAEVHQRKGLTRRTLLSFIWFFVCLIMAYLLTGWLVRSGVLDSSWVPTKFSLSPELDVQILRVVAMLVMVGLLQFFAIVLFAMSDPAARVRSGQPTAVAQSIDYYERNYNSHNQDPN